jgi:hypothetical protein
MLYCASRPSPVSMSGLKIVLKIGYIIHQPFLRIHRAPPITSCVPPSQLTETLTVQVDNFSTRRGKGNFQNAVVYGIENGRYCVVPQYPLLAPSETPRVSHCAPSLSISLRREMSHLPGTSDHNFQWRRPSLVRQVSWQILLFQDSAYFHPHGE